jgi:hypothetical protein
MATLADSSEPGNTRQFAIADGRPSQRPAEDAMQEQPVNETTHAGNSRPAGDDEYQAKLAHAMRRALKRAADYAMRQDDAVASANLAIAQLHAEFLWRFEILRSRQRQPDLIVPDHLPRTVSQLTD